METQTGYLETWSDKLKAIAHPERLAILKMLCSCPAKQLTVNEIYTGLELSQPTVSKHLAILKRSGICRRKPAGMKTFYLLSDKGITMLIKTIIDEKSV
jgi:DNA-binding transcriptional ArsR family regulator